MEHCSISVVFKIKRQLRIVFSSGMELVFATLILRYPARVFWQSYNQFLRDSADSRQSEELNCALYAHVFYADLLEEILELHKNFPSSAPLIISACGQDVENITERCKDFPHVKIIPVENRGRDIAPLFQLLSHGIFDSFDAILKIHTKKSPHLWTGNVRRKMLFDILGGQRETVNRIMNMFSDKRTGLVGWRASFRTGKGFWTNNKKQVESILSKFDVDPACEPAFFEGSMFWFRPKALERLLQLKYSTDDFEEEAGQIDGMLHHALERVFVQVAAQEGYDTRSVQGKVLFKGEVW